MGGEGVKGRAFQPPDVLVMFHVKQWPAMPLSNEEALLQRAWFETRVKDALLTMTKILQPLNPVMVRATKGSVSNHAPSSRIVALRKKQTVDLARV